MPYVDVNSAWDPVGSGVFQTGAGGLHYLASGAHRDAGTSNIDPTLADELRKETTYAPQSLPRYLTADRLLTQYAPRDGDGRFDRGYHYDPIDYAALGTALYPAVTVTIAPGVVVGAGAGQLGSFGFGLLLNSKLQAQGSPLDRVRLTHLSNVHEAPYTATYDNSALLHQVQSSKAFLQFTVLGARREGDELFTSGRGDYRLRDCRLQVGSMFGPSNYTLAATNCIFEHVYVGLASQSTLYCWLYNNTFDHGSVLLQDNGHNGTFEVHDNIFQETALNWIGVAHSYNGYIYAGSMPAWVNTQNGDVPLASLAFQNGPLSPQFGDFYLPSSSGLESGSRTVAAAGLFHYTTRVDQQKDIQQVDLGFHYVALNANQQPVDSDGDYLPDYFEDANGNGMQDGTEFSSSTVADSDGDGVLDGGEDPDGDKLSNIAELKFGHLPFVADHAIVPRKLLIYYGWPSAINGAKNYDDNDPQRISVAASEFSAYDYVVLGAHLEESSHGDHKRTLAIIAATHNTMFFGYIDLGTMDLFRNQWSQYNLGTIEQRLEWWKAMGVHGIFFDDFGFDYIYDVDGDDARDRQNAAVNMAHNLGLAVVANGFHPEDVFGNGWADYPVDPLHHTTTHVVSLGQNGGYIDFYCYEGHQYNDGGYVPTTDDPGNWKTKADQLHAYQTSGENTEFDILSITTTPSGYDAAGFYYSWLSAFLYGHEGTGWGEAHFSSDFPMQDEAPSRSRPSISLPEPGDIFIENEPIWSQANTTVTRHTGPNPQTTTGTITVNTQNHIGTFTKSQ